MSEADPPRRVPPEELAPRYGVGRLTRHVLVCCGPACCTAAEGTRTWGAMKRAVAAINVDGGGPRVFRTRCECLRMCDQGPIAVVYPEGVWYKRVTPEAAGRIAAEHLACGRPVTELTFAQDDLSNAEREPDNDQE